KGGWPASRSYGSEQEEFRGANCDRNRRRRPDREPSGSRDRRTDWLRPVPRGIPLTSLVSGARLPEGAAKRVQNARRTPVVGGLAKFFEGIISYGKRSP